MLVDMERIQESFEFMGSLKKFSYAVFMNDIIDEDTRIHVLPVINLCIVHSRSQIDFKVKGQTV